MDHYKDLYHLSTDDERAKGLVWYNEARSFCQGLADKYNVTLEQAVGVVAALSPRCPWNLNCSQAAEFIRKKGRAVHVTTYYNNKEKALAILKGSNPLDVLKGSKTRSFYENILNPDSSQEVTVDTIMIRAFFNDPNHNEHQTFSRPTELRLISQTIKDLAAEKGLLPLQLQAILWQTWKRITDTKPFTNEVNYEGLLQ